MQNQTISALNTHPAVILTILPDFSVASDWSDVEARQLLDAQTEPVFFIIDMRQMKILLDDLLLAASKGGRGSEPLWHHPKVRGVYFVSESRLVAMAVNGLSSPVFGKVKARLFGTLEDALADIEQLIAA